MNLGGSPGSMNLGDVAKRDCAALSLVGWITWIDYMDYVRLGKADSAHVFEPC